jgi:hypothetical protein
MEATHGGHELIELEHLFIGVCKVGASRGKLVASMGWQARWRTL